jgi:hypothetical protein
MSVGCPPTGLAGAGSWGCSAWPGKISRSSSRCRGSCTQSTGTLEMCQWFTGTAGSHARGGTGIQGARCGYRGADLG